MLKQIFNNYYFKKFIYICLIVIIVSLGRKRFVNQENFALSKNIKLDKKVIIHSIIPSIDKENLYYGTYFTSKNRKRKDVENLVYTYSLKSNEWHKVKNSKLDNKTLIFDLNYDEKKRLTAIGLTYENNEAVYDIFVKKNNDVDSKWVKMNSNRKMRSICFDNKTQKIIGISSYDGQIYESDGINDTKYVKWIGPINYDKPMKKVLFNRDGIMLGIGLIDNYIYKKNGKDWRYSEWDSKNMNKTKVYDLFYDRDGCLIGTTSEGIKKQINQDFNSEFVNILNYKEKHEEIMNIVDILKSRVGIEFVDEMFDTSTELGKDLKRIYEFKKISKDLCSNKVSLKKYSNKKNNLDLLSKQNQEINNLYKIIDEISNKMN